MDFVDLAINALVAAVAATGAYQFARSSLVRRLDQLVNEKQLLMEKTYQTKIDELTSQLDAANTNIIDLMTVEMESRLVRRIDEDIHNLSGTRQIWDRTVHRICDDLRKFVAGAIAFDINGDQIKFGASWGIDESTAKSSGPAILSILPAMIASQDVVIWNRAECDHLKLPIPNSALNILVVPVSYSDRILGCLVIFANGNNESLPGLRRTLKSTAQIVARAAYRTRLAEELEETQRRDKLTGMYNRSALISHLDDCGDDMSVGLVVVEGCGFKELNDKLGRDVADQLVIALSQTFSSCARKRENDSLYRVAGAQFAILLKGVQDTIVMRIAERIMSALQARTSWPGDMATWSISVAVAASSDCESPKKLLNAADDVLLYLRQNNSEGRLLSASQLPSSFLSQRRTNTVGLSGSLVGFNPNDVLRSASLAASSGIVRVTPKTGQEFWAFFEAGKLQKAKLGKLQGDNAVIEFITTFEEGDFIFKEATVESLTGTADDVSRLGRSYSTQDLEEVLLDAAMAQDNLNRAHALIPTVNRYVMATPQSQSATAWTALETGVNALSEKELALMKEMLKFCLGQFKLSEVFQKLDSYPTAHLHHCAAMLLQEQFIRLSSLKVYAHA